MEIVIAEGLGRLVGRYRGVICDLWGAVHDGERPYPGASDCLARIRAAGLPVVLLSNAPRPAGAVARRLDEMGVLPGSHYDALITSGDATALALNEDRASGGGAFGRRFHWLGPPRDQPLIDAIEGRAPVELAQADFLLATGLFDDDRETPDDYRERFAPAVGRGLPMVCANPDVVVVRGRQLVWCAGALARLYEAMGGRVVRHGKPYPGVFGLALAQMPGVAKESVLMLGDGPETDLAGAAAAGIDAVWIAGGIHAEDIGLAPGGPLDAAAVHRFLAARGQRPVAAVPALVW